jgi:uncharacterized coiled-coil protein SlyX
MTSEETILNEIKHMRNDFGKFDQRLSSIEEAVKVMAVQSNQIQTLDRNVAALWKVKDTCANEMRTIQTFQASCPREQIEKMRSYQKEALTQQWTAIKWLAGTMMAGFGIIGAFMRFIGV